MVKLNKNEIEWLRNNYPQMIYDEERSVIAGLFSINHKYNGINIKDCFNIEVRLYAMRNREEYPKVYNTDGRIQKIAKRKNMKIQDLHVYSDNSLCLGLPARFFLNIFLNIFIGLHTTNVIINLLGQLNCMEMMQ